MKLFDSGAYLLRGRELLNAQELSARLGREVSPDQGRQGTMAYGILQKHNTSGNKMCIRDRGTTCIPPFPATR